MISSGRVSADEFSAVESATIRRATPYQMRFSARLRRPMNGLGKCLVALCSDNWSNSNMSWPRSSCRSVSWTAKRRSAHLGDHESVSSAFSVGAATVYIEVLVLNDWYKPCLSSDS